MDTDYKWNANIWLKISAELDSLSLPPVADGTVPQAMLNTDKISASDESLQSCDAIVKGTPKYIFKNIVLNLEVYQEEWMK